MELAVANAWCVHASLPLPGRLQACHSGRLLRLTKPVGSYKLDVATVYAQTGTLALTTRS